MCRTGAITTKESYYFTSNAIPEDARQFLVPWMGFPHEHASSERAVDSIQDGWFETALKAAQHASNTANARVDRLRGGLPHIVFSTAVGKLPGPWQPCKKYYLLEATPHNINTPIAAARIKKLFPDARVAAVLKEPVHRMMSAYNQFGNKFKSSCEVARPAPWCPIYRYYRLQLPSFPEVVEQDLAYLQAQGCTFQQQQLQRRSWLECFGCELMDPWREPPLYNHPYAPSIALGMYAPMLSAWLELFPASAFNILNYEELVTDPKRLVNTVLRSLELEEYTDAHWKHMRPERAGFRGQYRSDFNPSDSQFSEAKAKLHGFYKSLNQQLEDLCRSHNISWTPFPA